MEGRHAGRLLQLRVCVRRAALVDGGSCSPEGSVTRRPSGTAARSALLNFSTRFAISPRPNVDFAELHGLTRRPVAAARSAWLYDSMSRLA